MKIFSIAYSNIIYLNMKVHQLTKPKYPNIPKEDDTHLEKDLEKKSTKGKQKKLEPKKIKGLNNIKKISKGNDKRKRIINEKNTERKKIKKQKDKIEEEEKRKKKKNRTRHPGSKNQKKRRAQKSSRYGLVA